jgi:hypothetical protein
VTNKWMISSTVLNAWDFQWDLAAVQGSYALTNRRARLLPGLSGAGNR